MKKYYLKNLLLCAPMVFSASLFAGDDMRKIDTDFDSLDNNDDGYVSHEEADDNNVIDHFAKIDINGDRRLSESEFRAYTSSHPDTVEEGEKIPSPRSE